ncbi:MAG: response regulator transcription factor [Actinobacteria bacterium]|nr:response regulator transcription factor [Actinomycetota bacterium]
MSRELVEIVDDNVDVRLFVRTSLEDEGFRVVEAHDGESAMEVFESEKPSVVILDLSMGQPDGFEVCRKIRMKSEVPIIMLTNRNEEVDEAMCLAAGADDYISKPVSARILGLRVATQIRHKSGISEVVGAVLTHSDLTLDTQSRQLTFHDKDIPLTRTEYEFLHLLMGSPKKIFTRKQVIEAIGGTADFANDHLLDTHASRLRQKIVSAGGPRIVAAVRGVGYRLSS